MLTGLTAGDVYKALWRHKFLILVLTAVCVAGAWYATSVQERTYEASTLVRIQQRTADPGETFAALQASERLARTYATIIGSDALEGAIATQVGGRVPPSAVSEVRLSAEPVEDLGLLWISAGSANAARAAIVANAVPPVLRAFSKDTGAVRDEIVTIKLAETPSSPSAPSTSLNVGLALLLALVFNSALVLLFEMFRDRLPDSEELGQELGYPVLATIPTLRLRRVGDVEGTLAEDALSDGRVGVAATRIEEATRHPVSRSEGE
jgi:capsular polysaccharide biosynthesis protein